MAEPKAGAEKDKLQEITLNWDFRFWDIRENAPLEGFRLLPQKGYEYLAGKGGNIAEASLEYADTGEPVAPNSVKAKFKTDTGIGRLTFDPGKRAENAQKLKLDTEGLTFVNLRLKVHPNHDSRRAAHPHIKSPRNDAEWNDKCQIQMRSLLFRV